MPFDFWTWYWAFTAFVFGAIVGSFLNVCIWRLPRGESLSHPASHCPACHHRLGFLPDMVPLLSQLWYRSRCRYCGERFSWRYFWVELFCGLMFLAIYLRYVPFGAQEIPEGARTWSALMGMAFAAALITLFFIDLEHYEIPDICVIIAVLAALGKDIFLIASGSRQLWHALPGTELQLPLPLSVLGGLISFWLLWQFAALGTAALGREAMGAGDSLLLGAMGAFLIPWPLVLFAFIVAVFLGTVGGVTGIWMARRAEMDAAPEAAAPDMPPPAAAGPFPEASMEVTPDSRANLPAVEPVAPGADLFPSHRGAVDAPGEPGPAPEGEPPAPEDDGIPALPPTSRWGRLLTVAGTWVAVAALWVGAAVWTAAGAPAALSMGAMLALAAAGMLWYGVRIWKKGDEEWLPAMDELFETGDPGPRFIPFGPYLVAGTFIAMLVGQPLIEWYLQSQGLSVGRMPWD